MSSHSATDSGMYKMMAIVMVALTVMTLLIIFTARSLSSGSSDEFDPLMQNALMQRIAPAGQVRTEAPVVVAIANAAPRSGEELANGVCAGCHASGAGGAPLFTDTDEWSARSASGLEALVASVVNGKGGMPAGGGSDYSNEEITRAVEYMTGLGNKGEVAEAAAAPAATETEAETETAENTDAAESTEAATAAAATESTTATETAAAVTTEASSGAEGVIAALTPRIQTTVEKGVCAGCHTAGVANAPKFTDTEDWAKRAEAGYAALAQSVINGKGAMPPRGGSDLTDDELLVAAEFMVLKSK